MTHSEFLEFLFELGSIIGRPVEGCLNCSSGSEQMKVAKGFEFLSERLRFEDYQQLVQEMSPQLLPRYKDDRLPLSRRVSWCKDGIKVSPFMYSALIRALEAVLAPPEFAFAHTT